MNMQTAFMSLTGLIVAVGLGLIYFNRQEEAAASPSPKLQQETQKDKEIAYWVAPMDPNYRRDKPGRSPMGMDLVPVYETAASNGGATGSDRKDSARGANGIHIAANIQANLGIKTAPVVSGDFTPIILAPAHLVYDDNRISRVQVRAEGWVEKLYVRSAGEIVKKGDALFALYSPEIATALGEYADARKRKSMGLQKLAKRRLRALGLSDQTISASLKSHLKTGLKSGNGTQVITFHAPRDGVVTRLDIREGSIVAKNTVAFEITDPTNLWLIADVFENDAAGLKQGATVDIIGSDDSHRQAMIDHIYPDLDKRTRTIQVRLNLPNPDGNLRPGQFFTVHIHGPAERSLIIPRQAVIRLGRGNHVMLAHGNGHFEAAQITLGKTSGDTIQVLHGLKKGEQVVTSGQFLLDSESSFSGARLRILDQPKEPMTHEGSMTPHTLMEPQKPMMDHNSMDHKDPTSPEEPMSLHREEMP
ncbi:MAG: efflux RND transporter periplasmic adaptor subunit [Emcibacter sp.]|nr:efflux RND transporter periplasmic adaptor subunit [Emcibacter sp.]